MARMLAFAAGVACIVVSVFGQTSDDVTPFVVCPSECSTDYPAVFSTCARPMILAGCTVKPCDGGGLRCAAPDVPLTGTEVLPGEEITFESARIYDEVLFNVNFTGSKTDTDLYLLSDATGSMSTAITNVKTKFADLISTLEVYDNLHVGVGLYRDEGEVGHDGGFINLQSVTADTDAALAAVQTLNAVGGGDSPEANLVALYKIATDTSIGWRASSRKIIAYFGDQPGHESTCYKGKTITRSTVISALNAKKITVVTVNFGYGDGMNSKTDRYNCDGTVTNTQNLPNQASAIALGTDGSIVSSTDQTLLVYLIERSIIDLKKKYYAEYPTCEGLLSIKFNPTLPVELADGETKTILQRSTILAGVCDELDGKTFTCQIDWMADGYKFPPTTLEILEIVGCPGE